MKRFGLRGPDALAKRAFLPHFQRSSAPAILPPKWSYLNIFPARRDQQDVGCCVGFTIAEIMAAVDAKHFGNYRDISARALYSLTQINREQSTIGQDDGMYAIDCIWTAMNIGYTYADEWPEEAEPTGNYFSPPPASILTKKNDIISFTYVGGYDMSSTAAFVDHCKAALFHLGPLAVGGPWANDWMDPGPSGNLVSNPQQGSAGGHERVRLAWDDNHDNLDGTKGAWLDLNSWSSAWGMDGLYWTPFSTVSSFLPDDVYGITLPKAAELAAAA